MKGTDIEHEDLKDGWNPTWLPSFHKTYMDPATGESRPLLLKEHQKPWRDVHEALSRALWLNS